MLKDSIDIIIAKMLRDTLSFSIMTSSFLNELKILKVVAVYKAGDKAGDKEDPYNYRLIAVPLIIYSSCL